MMRAAGDRRTRVRFEVFGAFWGTFDAGDAVRVHDLTPHGALIELPQPLAVESIQSICLFSDGQPAFAHARICHIRQVDPDSRRFLIGIEFLSASSAFSDAVERLLTISSIPEQLSN